MEARINHLDSFHNYINRPTTTAVEHATTVYPTTYPCVVGGQDNDDNVVDGAKCIIAILYGSRRWAARRVRGFVCVCRYEQLIMVNCSLSLNK